MKMKRFMMAALLVLAVSGMSLSPKALKETSVTYQVDPSYEVVIPTDVAIPFLAEEVSYGKILIQEAILEENKCILVEINSGGALVNDENPNATIPYQILCDGKPFTGQKYTKAGEETKLEISIRKEDWNKAAGGTYRTAVTFRISYVDKE